ncbi:MAG: ABC transporter permease [Oscillospiraceae bacterium]
MSRQRLKNGASELQAINRRRDIHRKTIPALAQAGPVSVWMVLFVTIPMLYIIYVSFMSRGVFGDVVYEFSLESYQTLLDSTYFKVIVKSLQVALFTTVACLLLGYPFAYYIARKPPEVASRPIMLIMIPFWTNSLMRLNSWLLLFQTSGPVNTFPPVGGYHQRTHHLHLHRPAGDAGTGDQHAALRVCFLCIARLRNCRTPCWRRPPTWGPIPGRPSSASPCPSPSPVSSRP